MKLCITFLCLLSTAVFANSAIRDYKGQYFNLESQVQCEREYTRISNIMNSTEGTLVLDGGCRLYGQTMLQIQFKYEAPITTTIDKFRHRFDSQEACEAQALLGSRVFTGTKAQMIASFCQGRSYRLDYIDKSYSVMRNLGLNANFKTLEACQTELKSMERVVSSYDMRAVLSNCKEVSTISRDGSYFRSEFFYFATYNRTLHVIKGRQVENDCLSQRTTIERDFADADVRLSHQFCTGYDEEREFLVYLDESSSVIPAVKEFKGIAYVDSQACMNNLSEIRARFSQLGKKTVYAFCDLKRANTFIPTIHYAQTR